MIPNTVEIWTTATVPHLLINMKEVELEKLSVSDMQNLKTVC